MILTYGLGRVCTQSNLNAVITKASLLIQPILLLFFISIVLLLARTTTFSPLLQRLQKQRSLLHVFWLIILWSYSAIAFTSFELLTCVKLGKHRVLFSDGSIRCFAEDHLPYGILAIILMTLFIAGLPFLLAWQSYKLSPTFKGFMDEATNIYSDNCGWWCSVNLLRRLLFSALAAANTSLRQEAIALSAVLLLAVHATVRYVIGNG